MTETTTAAALAEEAKLWITQVAVAAHQRSPARTKVAVEALEAFIDAMAKDAARWRSMRQRFIGADWDWNGNNISVAMFEIDPTLPVFAGPECADAYADCPYPLSLHQTDTKEQQQ